MFKIIDFLIKIVTLPFVILSLPFKAIDWVFKIIGLIFLLIILYFFGWIPPYNEFMDNTFPDITSVIKNLKQLLGLLDKIPLDQLNEAKKFIK